MKLRGQGEGVVGVNLLANSPFIPFMQCVEVGVGKINVW